VAHPNEPWKNGWVGAINANGVKLFKLAISVVSLTVISYGATCDVCWVYFIASFAGFSEV
jgi:hypothetical protein